MQYLALEEVSKSFGEKTLFNKINLVISKGDKIALIAKNGSGKSTLLRVIAGTEDVEGEHAKIILNQSVKTAFLSQEPIITSDRTVLDLAYDVDSAQIKAYRKHKEALLDNDTAAIEKTMLEVESLNAWNAEANIKEILYKLNLDDLEQPVSQLSGGQLKRLSLAQVILAEPDFLILDEPTNHLDVEMIEWLEKYLSASTITVLMVTHDRYFLERICTEIIELDKGALYPYKGNYSDYLEKKAIRTEVATVTHEKAKKLLSKELQWIRRQPKARGTKAKSRITSYDKLHDQVSSITYDQIFEIEIDTVRLGKKIMEFYDVSKAYDDKVILKDFWYKFKKGERVGISGKNGSGKSTFVKIIAGEEKHDTGKLVVGDTVAMGHYKQTGFSIADDKRVIDVIRDIGDYIPLKKGLKLSAAKLLENFMFSRDQQQVYVSQLSGGEKKRLHLLTVLMKNPNFLILDEPTNDLDLLTLQVLEDYLMSFTGCLVIVSHDRFFMDKLIEHMFVFSGEGNIQDFNGTYSEWKAQAKNPPSSSATEIKEKTKAVEAVTDEDPVRKLSYMEKKEMKQLENKISKLEKSKAAINKQFETGELSGEDIQKLSIELGEVNTQLDESEMRWLELSEFM